ncbi:hypothetical protein [Algibacter pectinivorans]|uniref:Branched-chain amino acid:cation transporter, LIVCS family n=1 Tax=Algibacter pectinivorans TaxID=870482 RepID=A0A1I1Q641_9FLAO|nr:hypothetical protein [Algibacter pectinivorans]SFD17487.1 hypothetical protein SAMN04487987_105221 [Algibacter pectinivorans]
MKNLITTSKTIAVLSFAIGTILFALQLYFSNSYKLIYPGIIFIFVAVIINTTALLGLLLGLIDNKNRSALLQATGLVLTNIPIAFLYFYILIETL